MDRARVTLGDLLAHDPFDLTLADPVDRAALDRRIAGVHPIEVDLPAQWLASDWVALTTGVRLRDKPQAQRRLVRELAEAGIAALGFGVGVVCEETPPALREEAQRLGFPVFDVPYATPFREIVAFVNGSLLSRELFTLRRAASMQRFLQDALVESDGEGEVVGRLASVLDCSAILFGCDGQPIVSCGHVPAGGVWAAMRDTAADSAEFESGEWLCRVAAVKFQGAASQWLVIATRRRSAFTSIAVTLQETAVRLLAVLACGQRAARAEERARRAALLDDLIDGTARPAELSDRLRSFGFAPRCPLRAYALEGGERELAATVASAALDARLPYLLTTAGDVHLLLTEEREADAERVNVVVEVLAERAPGAKIGIGRPTCDFLAIPQCVREAIAALDYGRRRGRGGTWYFEDLDLVGLALAIESSGELTAKAAQTLAPIEASGHLLTTLVTYFDAQLDVARAAARLHLHPNSLRYRLAQIEKILGQDIRHPATIANLYLALVHARLGGDLPESVHADSASVDPVLLVGLGG